MNPFSFATFWAKWKIVIILIAALSASVGINFYQLNKFTTLKATHKEQIKTATAEARAQVAEEQRAIIEGMQKQKALDDLALADMAKKLSERKVERVTEYRDRIRTIEVPVCRVNAAQILNVNRVLQ